MDPPFDLEVWMSLFSRVSWVAIAGGFMAGFVLAGVARVGATTQVTYPAVMCVSDGATEASADDVEIGYGSVLWSGVGVWYGSYPEMYIRCPIVDVLSMSTGPVLHHWDYTTIRLRGEDALSDNDVWVRFCLQSPTTDTDYWCSTTVYSTATAGGSTTASHSFTGNFYLNAQLGGASGHQNSAYVSFIPTLYVGLPRSSNAASSIRSYEVWGP